MRSSKAWCGDSHKLVDGCGPKTAAKILNVFVIVGLLLALGVLLFGAPTQVAGSGIAPEKRIAEFRLPLQLASPGFGTRIANQSLLVTDSSQKVSRTVVASLLERQGWIEALKAQMGKLNVGPLLKNFSTDLTLGQLARVLSLQGLAQSERLLHAHGVDSSLCSILCDGGGPKSALRMADLMLDEVGGTNQKLLHSSELSEVFAERPSDIQLQLKKASFRALAMACLVKYVAEENTAKQSSYS